MAFPKARGNRAKGYSNRGDSSAKSKDSTDESPRQLSPERQEQRARNVLLYQLARSAKSAHQLRQILEKREIDSEIAEAVIQRFIEVGLIDDKLFAETIVNSRRKFKGSSKSVIKRELVEKGVGSELIEDVVSEITAADELATATELAIKRIPRLATLERDVRQRRLFGYLSRKGYGSNVVLAACKAAEDSINSDQI
jgi:regulatory protein